MIRFDIAYSLNKQAFITAATWEEAEAKLKEQIAAEGIKVYNAETDENEDGYTLEVFDVEEEEE